MILEKIVKYAKVAATNRFIPAAYALAGTAAVGALADGRISSIDSAILLIAGTVVAIGTVSFVREQITYRNVERICENYGFVGDVMRNESLRRKAKIYAAGNGRMGDFALALRQYQL